MPLDDDELDKICFGRIIKARVFDSSGMQPTEPHWGVVVSSDAQIAAKPRFRAVMISSNTSIDSVYVVAVPAYTGLKGHFICSWIPEIEEAGVIAIKSKLIAVDLIEVVEMARRHMADKGKSQ